MHPPDYVERLLPAIVGLEIDMIELVGKWKATQNRSAADRAGWFEVSSPLATPWPRRWRATWRTLVVDAAAAAQAQTRLCQAAAHDRRPGRPAQIQREQRWRGLTSRAVPMGHPGVGVTTCSSAQGRDRRHGACRAPSP
jgi:hypothetical protein